MRSVVRRYSSSLHALAVSHCWHLTRCRVCHYRRSWSDEEGAAKKLYGYDIQQTSLCVYYSIMYTVLAASNSRQSTTAIMLTCQIQPAGIQRERYWSTAKKGGWYDLWAAQRRWGINYIILIFFCAMWHSASAVGMAGRTKLVMVVVQMVRGGE